MAAGWLILPACLVAWIAYAEVIRCRRERAAEARALGRWQETAPEQRLAAFTTLVAGNPRCGTAWYLLGTAQLRDADYAAAARSFGMAHHMDYRLASAALFTFSCLKAAADEPTDIRGLVQHVGTTWVEMKRPTLGLHPQEQAVWSVFARDADLVAGLSAVGRVTWLVAGENERAELEAALRDRPDWFTALVEDGTATSRAVAS